MKPLPKTSRHGSIMILVAVLLPVMLILAAVAINFAYLDLCQTELYTANDAAVRAAGREFTISHDQAAAIVRGKQLALENTVAGVGLQLQDSDFTFGGASRNSVNDRYSFDPSASPKNSVKIDAHRNASAPDGPIPLFLPSILGSDFANISQSSISTGVEVDIALVLDRSGSMAFAFDEISNPFTVPYSAPPGWQFCDPAPPICRWRDLVDAVGIFLNELNNSALNDRLSVSTYNHLAATEISLTENYSNVFPTLQNYTNNFCAGATNIGGGLNEGIGSLFSSPAARPHAAKVIVLLTDGIHNTGTDPMGPAQSAADGGVLIFTITVSNEADKTAMINVANTAHGQHFHADSPADLVQAFETIARTLPNLLTQ